MAYDYLTDEDVMNMIQNTVIEPGDWGATWPSGLWSTEEVLMYLNERQNLFLKDTQLQFGIAEINATAGVNQYDLPDDWVTTIRVLWVAPDGTTTELPRSDNWEADYGIPNWSYVQAQPKIFWDGGKPISLRLMPIPSSDGVIQIHYVPLASNLDGSGEVFTLPTEFVPAVKYGALADMLSKVGRAQDQGRADYCLKRYRLGVQVARLLVGGFDQ